MEDNNTNNFKKPCEKIEISQQYIAQLLYENQDIPIKIANVNTLASTSKSSVKSETLSTFLNDTIFKCEKLSDLTMQSEILMTRLHQSNLISAMIPIFETDKPDDDKHELPIPLPITVTLRYQPKSHFTAKTGTNITNSGQGDAYLTFQKRGLLGRDETITLDHRRDTGTNSGSNLSIVWPYLLHNNAFLSGKIDIFDMWKFLGVRDVGSAFTLKSCFTKGWNHEFGLEFLKRRFQNTHYIETAKNKNNFVSERLLIQEGEFLKNSLRWSSVLDARNSSIAPSKGYLMKLNNEIAFDWDKLKFWKVSTEYNWIKSWFKNDFITMSNTAKCGYIMNLKPADNYIHFVDKFQNGGPNDIRSFSVLGLGPRELGQSLGGDAFVAYGVSIFSRLPIRRISNSGFRLHWFFNGGKLINHNSMLPKDCINALMKEHSTSIGMGLTLRHPMARFELNFAVPVTTHEDDLIRKGFQFGLGFEFL